MSFRGSDLDPSVAAAVVVVVIGSLILVNLPSSRRPFGVRSTGEVTIMRAHSWLVLPAGFLVAIWWAGARHLGEQPAMLTALIGFSLVICAGAYFLWRNCRCEFAADRVVLRASYTGRRIGEEHLLDGQRQMRMGFTPTTAFWRPTGLHLGIYRDSAGSWRADSAGAWKFAPELWAFAGLVRGQTWGYRALREVARAGHWPAGITLVVTHQVRTASRRRILDEIAACGVDVVYDPASRRRSQGAPMRH